MAPTFSSEQTHPHGHPQYKTPPMTKAVRNAKYRFQRLLDRVARRRRILRAHNVLAKREAAALRKSA